MTTLEIVLETRAPTKTFESDGAPVRAEPAERPR